MLVRYECLKKNLYPKKCSTGTQSVFETAAPALSPTVQLSSIALSASDRFPDCGASQRPPVSNYRLTLTPAGWSAYRT